MRCVLLVVVAVISSAGCAAESERGVSGAAGARGAREKTHGDETKGCPHPIRVTPTPGQCAGLPADYGLSPQHPLEWGMGAMLGLGGDALMCENGGQPSARRLGSLVAPVEYRPTGPHIGALRSDMLDQYEVICPGDTAPRAFYVNSYRCGVPCFPGGFRAMSDEAHQQLSAALAALNQERFAEALEHAQRAQALEPASELVHARLATALFVSKRYDEAFSEFQQARTIDAKDPYHRLHAAMSKLATGDAHYYRTVVEELLAELPAQHPLVEELHCRHAHALRRDGELDRAKPLAKRACAASQQDCCW